jgi:hypothetical protein
MDLFFIQAVRFTEKEVRDAPQRCHSSFRRVAMNRLFKLGYQGIANSGH